MGKQRELRLLRKLREAERELAGTRLIVRAAERFVVEIYFPNIKEPFSIHNRRGDLVAAVEAWRSKLGLPSVRRAA